MITSRVPDLVYKDVTDFCERTRICRMDSNQKSAKPLGEYTVDIGGIPVSFDNVELAPPQGIVSANYSRPIHREHQPHKYAFAWTITRTLGTEISDGGHFYFAKYGIRVRSAPNTLVIWMPEEDHGTGLSNISPQEAIKGLYQTGMSIVTSSFITSAWKKYEEKMMDASDLAERDYYPTEHYSSKHSKDTDSAAGGWLESSSDERSDSGEDSDN